MPAGYEQIETELDPATRVLKLSFRLVNRGDVHWRESDGFALGWQIFDADTGTFIYEGDWSPLNLAPAETSVTSVPVQLPKEKGRYRIFISPIVNGAKWLYQSGQNFLCVEAHVEMGRATLIETRVTSLRALNRKARWRSLKRLLVLPFRSVFANWSLIRSMARRDILSRYRGSFGDVLWAVLNPLLLMSTYFFVFGVVLGSKFGADNSRTGFALYFLAGMLPWLAFSEAVGRSPHVIVEHRNFVKKLVFPLEILPVTQTISGLVTQGFAMLVFFAALLAIRGTIQPSIAWLPLLLVPQLMFTLGLAWFLSALGVYMRDLGQIIGFLLTLWFFLTPICYPETSLPAEAAGLLTKNPMYVLVRGYRSILLEGQMPALHSLWKLWVAAGAVLLLGHACFYKLRKSFADVI